MIHQKLKKILKDIDYREEEFSEKGLCNGFTMKWLEACILNDRAGFSRIINNIDRYSCREFRRIPVKIANDSNATADEVKMFVLLKNMIGYQHPKGSLNQRNVYELSMIFGDERIKSQGGLVNIYDELWLYTKQELINHFHRITEIAHEIFNDISGMIFVKINRETHTCALVYETESRAWTWSDINFWPDSKSVTDEEKSCCFPGFCKEITIPDLLEQSRFVFPEPIDIQVITLANDPKRDLLSQRLNLLKQDYVVTEDVANRVRIEQFLLMSLQRGNADIFTQALHFGLGVHWVDARTGLTFVHGAAFYGNRQILIELAERGADLNKASFLGSTPLCIAAEKGHLEIIETLVELGVDPNIALNGGMTPLLCAVNAGQREVVKMLVRLGVSVNGSSSDGINVPPLCYTAVNNQEDMFDELILLGADVNQSVDDGETSVHCASRKGHLNILIKLAQLNANLNQPDKNGRTALYRAAYDGLGLIVSELIRLGADPNLPSHEGVTPLFIAAQKGHLDVVNNILTGSRAIEYMPFKTTPVKLMEFGFTVHHPYFFGRAVRSRIKQLIQSKSLSVHDHATAIYLLPEDIALIMGHQAIVARLDRFGCEHGVPLAQLVMRANELVPHNNTQATRGAWSRWVHFFSPEQSYQRFEREHDVPLSEAPIQVCKTM